MGTFSKLLLFTIAAFIAVHGAAGQVDIAKNVSAQPNVGARKLPVYDVASIKPSKREGGWGIDVHENRYSATNVLLKTLLGNAYGIKEDLIFGVPGSMSEARFDIEAKVVDPDPEVIKKLTARQYEMMLRLLLVERFQLKAHTEARILPVYELIVAKGGSQLRRSSDEDREHAGMSVHNRELTAHDLTVTAFANGLSSVIRSTIVDKTGIAGSYDFALKWSPDDGSAQPDGAPSLFTALQEQLGLKLQPAKGPVEVLVVDSVAMPSEN